MTDILFDQYQRYKKTQEIITALRVDNETFNILEVGANEHRNLEKFLPKDKITYLDIQLDEVYQNNPQFILGDATDMDFQDNSYDFIVALDVFEHIPVSRRKLFINEINRVAKKAFILMAPFDIEGVAEAEKNVNAFFKELVGHDHPWLIEHIENGLPAWEETLQYLQQQDIEYVTSSQCEITMWENLMRYHFLSVYSNKVLEEVNVINSFYNKKIYPVDEGERCYRRIIIGSKNKLNYVECIADKEKQMVLLSLNTVEAQFYKKLCKAYENNELLSLKDNHINNLEDMVKAKDNHINNLEDMVKAKDNHINNLEDVVRAKDVHINNLEDMVKAKDNHINNLEDMVKAKDNHIDNLEYMISAKEGHINELEHVVEAQENHINNLENMINAKDNHISNIENQIVVLNNEIDVVRDENQKCKDEINRIYSTIIGKILLRIINTKR